MSDIVLGTGSISGEEGEQIGRLAIERGVNYFDTAPDYSGAASEAAMGRAMRGQRDSLFIATKFCTPTGHLHAGSSVANYKAAIEGSLKRLGTDYVDLCHVHSCDTVERLMDENAHEAFDRLKQEGKVPTDRLTIGRTSQDLPPPPNLVGIRRSSGEAAGLIGGWRRYHHHQRATIRRLTRRRSSLV